MTGSNAMVMRSVLFASLVLCAQGCTQKPDPDLLISIEDAGRIQLGDSVDEIRAMTGAAGEFGFQAQSDRGELLGLEYAIGSTNGRVFMIFRDGKLRQVSPVKWGDRGTITGEDRPNSGKLDAANPRNRLVHILNCDTLIGDQLVEFARERHPGRPDAIPNVLVPAIAVSVIMPPYLVWEITSDIEYRKHEKERDQLETKLAYDNIQWGMTPDEVRAVYGDPYFEQQAGAIKGCVYGDRRLGVQIAFEYIDNQVRAKYGRRFAPFDWTGEQRKQTPLADRN